MAGYEGLGGFWPYPGSGPSGSSDTEAGLARLEALRYVDVDAPQDTPPPTAAELRESLREITNSTKPSESTGPRNRDQILASLHGEEGWQTESELRKALAAVADAKEQLKALQAEIARAEESNQAIDPDAIQKIVGGIHKSLEGVNSYFLEKAATIVGTAAHQDAVALEGMHKQYNELGQ